LTAGYGYARAITIDHRQVANTDQTDFPILISGTFPFLATAANGGRVQNTNGYDIVFTSDTAGQNQLDHEIDSYDPVTGTAAFWVRIPLLSHTTDTPIYMWYGNSAVVASQENKPGVWKNGYAAVWHMDDDAANPTVQESTANDNAGVAAVNTNTRVATGEISGALTFNGSSDSVTVSPGNSLSNLATNPATFSAWIKTAEATGGIVMARSDSNGSAGWLWGINSDDTMRFTLIKSGGNARYTTNTAVSNNIWTYAAITYDGSGSVVNGAKSYINGVAVGHSAGDGGGSQTSDANYPFYIGYNIYGDSAAQHFNGLLDEVRVSNVARSADWIATEYTNQSSPSTFYAVGPEQTCNNTNCTAVPFITTSSLPTGIQNVAYSATLTAIDGVAPYTWSITSGRLPAGLSLNASTGAISGTPTANGTNSFTVQVADSNSTVATQALSLTIQPPLTAGYGYARAITIDHRQVANTDQTDFPILISGTFPFLATVANGGRVQNTNGYDIVFTSDTAGQNQLDHEIESYNPTTGTAAFWVRIPLLSHTTDTSIFMWYGNSAVVASQENKAGAWRNGFVSVFHFDSATESMGGVDSLGNNSFTSNSGTVTTATGEIVGAIGVNNTGWYRGSTQSLPAGTAARTSSTWFKMNTTGQTAGLGGWGDNNTNGERWDFWVYPGGLCIETRNDGGGNISRPDDTNWHYVACILPGGGGVHDIACSLDGAALAGTGNGSLGLSTTTDYLATEVAGWWGQAGGNVLHDEFHVANVARSSDWIATEYNNQSSPGTFVYVSPTEASGTNPSPYPIILPPTSFSYARALTIDHRQVANTDQTDFPVLISGTFPFLATVANGGRVQNANGYDIVFTSDTAGQNQLDHEIDSYSPATGAAAFWVRIPLLSHTTDTAVYMWYGNSGVAASQENKPGVWRNGYAAVWHLGDGKTVNATDSTGVNNGTVFGITTSSSAEIGGAAQFSGSASSYIVIPDNRQIKPATAITLEGWINPASTTGGNDKIFSLDYAANGTFNSPWSAPALLLWSNATAGFEIAGTGGTANFVSSSQAVPLSQWTHVAGTYDGAALRIYLNGAPDTASTPLSGPISYGTSKALTIGIDTIYDSSAVEAWNGLLDELRISSVARSADWIATQYHNQSSPGTFFFVSPTEFSGTPSPYPIILPPTTFNYARALTINHRQVANTDQTDFPVLISGTFPFLATIANGGGGRLQNTNGYDVVFTSDAAGQNELDHEIDSYDPVTGTAAFWVRIPLLSHTMDTPVYMWYGNSAVVASQENRPGVWRNGYAGVWHFANSGVLAVDSSGKNVGTVSSVTSGAGEIAGGGSFSGSTSSYIRVTNSTSFKPATAITLEGWVSPSTVTAWNKVFALDYRADGTWNPPYVSYALNLNNNTLGLALSISGAGSLYTLTSAGTIPLNMWSHIAGTFDTSSHLQRLYINGVEDANTLTNDSSAIDYGTSQDLTLGQRSPYSSGEGWYGGLDELRISTVARSADWIATEYNNQLSPSTFYFVSPEQPASLPENLAVANLSLPSGPQNVPYTSTLMASGGVAPYTWTIPMGALPAGLSLNAATGMITGTPATAVTSNFVAQVMDANLHYASRFLSITIYGPLTVTTTSLPPGAQRTDYSTMLGAVGGIPPYTWSIASGSLPLGLSLNPSTGAITGIPIALGTSTLTVQVTDAISNTASAPLSIAIELQSGYATGRPIVLIHLQVPNTDQEDFPVLIAGTYPYLATVANGGGVQNSNGYDIIFTSDPNGQLKLDHEIDSYDPLTGTVAFWVRVPLLSHTSDTTIYLWRGTRPSPTRRRTRAGSGATATCRCGTRAGWRQRIRWGMRAHRRGSRR